MAGSRKRIKLVPGDVFEFTVSDGRLGYGVIVLGGGVPYVIILKSLHATRPELTALCADEIALVGTTMDSLVYHGRWVVVYQGFPIPSRVPFPNWKVGTGAEVRTTDFSGNLSWPMRADEIDLLDFKFSRSPIGYQTALEAMHGLAEWREDYEKLTIGYAAKRVTRDR
jgi:hypothetical protein